MESLQTLKPLFPGLTDAELQRTAELRHKARTDFFYLANEILGFRFQKDVHQDLFDVLLQKNPELHFTEQDVLIKNRLILWPRGHYKSTAKAVEVIQLILCFPNIRILLMTGTQKLASEGLSQIKGFFEGTSEGGLRLRTLFPDFCGTDIGNKSEFTVPARNKNLREPTVSFSTIGTTKASSHYDVLFLDDVVTEINSITADQIEAVIEAYLHCLPLLDPGGYLYVIGTRYNWDELYGWLLDNIQRDQDKTWKVSIRSCWQDVEQDKFVDGHLVGKETVKKLLFPERRIKSGELIGFTVEYLQTLQRNNVIWFANQYENNPIGGGQEVFPEQLIDRHTLPFEQIPKAGPVIVVWDLAWGLGETADDSVGIAARIHNGKFYVLEIRAGKFQTYELIQHIFDMLLKWRPVKLAIEKSVGAVYLQPSLEEFARKYSVQLPLEWIQPSNKKGAKHSRIIALQALLMQDRLWFFAGMEQYEKLLQQFTKYPKTKHDDFPDAVSLLLELTPHLQVVDTLSTHPAFQQQQQPRKEDADEWSVLGGLGNGFNG